MDGVRGPGEGVVFVVRVTIIVEEGQHGGTGLVLAGNVKDGVKVGHATVSRVGGVTYVDTCVRVKGVDNMMGAGRVPGVGGLEEDWVVAPSRADFSAKLKSFHVWVGEKIGGVPVPDSQVTNSPDHAAQEGVGGRRGVRGLGAWVRLDIDSVVMAEHGE